jgi:hypothetical protein
MIHDAPPDIVLLGTTTLLLLTKVITNEEAWRGISSPSLLVIAVLFLGCSTGCRVSQGQSPQSLCRYLCRYCAGTALVLF